MVKFTGISKMFKRDCCEHLVKYTGQEIEVNGTSAGIGNFKIDIGSFSNKIKEINKVPEVMKALDNYQYLLCKQAYQLDNDPSLKDECTRIRLMTIQSMTHLQTLLSISKPDKELRAKIVEWIEEMGKLNKRSIDLLMPSQQIKRNEKDDGTPSTPIVIVTHEQNTQGPVTRISLSDEIKEKQSQLQPEISVITKLGTEEGFLDSIFDDAQREALDTFNDPRLSYFGVSWDYEVTVSPSAILCVYFEFYSKWANKVCRFQYSSIDFKLKHYKPNKHARFDFEKEVFNDLPWKTNPHFLQALNKVYDKIKPLHAVQGARYQIWKRVSDNWNIKFEDGSNGNEYSFEWNGLGLDENRFKQKC